MLAGAGFGAELAAATGRRVGLGLLAWALTAGRLAWPLALTATTASATRLTLAGRMLRQRSPASGVALH